MGPPSSLNELATIVQTDNEGSWSANHGQQWHNDGHGWAQLAWNGSIDHGHRQTHLAQYVVTQKSQTTAWSLTTETSGEADHMDYASTVQVVAQVITVVVIIGATLFGNSVMCYTVYRMPNLRTVTNIFTMNLGITDLGVGLFVLPVWIVSMTTGANSTETPFPKALCQVTAFLTVALLLVSIATLAGISLDRYLSICYPLHYPMEVTSKRVFFTLTYMWLQSIVLASTPFFGWGEYKFRPQTVAICNPVWVGHMEHAAFMLTIGVGIPFAIMLFSYTRIIQAARKQAKRIEQIQLQLVNPWVNTGPPPSPVNSPETILGVERSISNSSRLHDLRRVSLLRRWREKGKRKRKRQLTGNAVFSNVSKNLKTLKTVFIVVGAFFLCWGPYVILNYWGVQNADQGIPYIADLLTTLLAFSNSAVNPFVFMFLTRDFRFAVRLIFSKCSECSRCRGMMDSCARVRRCSRNGNGNGSAVEGIRIQSRASNDSGVDVDSVIAKTSPQHKLLLNKLIGPYENVAFKRCSMELQLHPLKCVIEGPTEVPQATRPQPSPLKPLPPRTKSVVSFSLEEVGDDGGETTELHHTMDSGISTGRRVSVRITPLSETVVFENVEPSVSHQVEVHQVVTPTEKRVHVVTFHEHSRSSLAPVDTLGHLV